MNSFKISIALLFVSTLTFGQNSEYGNWLQYFGNQKINKNFNWHNEVQYRSYNALGDTNQWLLRTGIGYNFTENNNNLLIGYAYINSKKYIPDTNDKFDINENRIFQQFITKQNFDRVFIQHRYRIEERFLPDDFQLRFRYLLGINLPLNKKTMTQNAIYLSAYDEIFINAQDPLFDRNRLYGALGYVINKNIKIEAGFMNQTSENSNSNQFQIAIFNSIPFKD